VLERRDEIVNEAQSKANQMLQDAKKQSEFMLSESELLRAVHEEASRIRQQITVELDAMRKKAFEEAEAARAQAYEEARVVREGADQYADTILGALDKNLLEFQSVVRNGQRYLKKARMDALQQQGSVVARSSAQAYSPADVASYSGYGNESAATSEYAQEFLKQTTLSH
jgi:vacuolar-type H+-ATPase subunit H